MVDIAEGIIGRFSVNLTDLIRILGFINGNKGKFEVWQGYTTSANVLPGIPLIRGTGGAASDASKCTETGANSEVAFSIAEADREQVDLNSDTYASGDLIPILPMMANPGMIFQGWVLDTDGNKNPDTVYDAGANGFAIADYANKCYAAQMYYVADTNATAQHLILYLLTGGAGG